MILVKSGVEKIMQKTKLKKDEKKEKEKKIYFIFIKMTYLLYIESIKRPAKNFSLKTVLWLRFHFSMSF